MLYGVKYTVGQFGSGVLAMLPSSFLCSSSLVECGKLGSPGFKVSTAQQQLNHQSVTTIILTMYPKHSTASATRKKINSIPSKPRICINLST